jgi:integrase
MEVQGTKEKKNRRKRMPRGMGSVRKRGPVWGIAYTVNGVRHSESSQSPRKEDAVDLLKQRLRELKDGTFAAGARKVTLADLREAVMVDCERNGRVYGKRVKQGFAHLVRILGEGTAAEAIGAMLDKFTKTRLSEPARSAKKGPNGEEPRRVAKATVNRELALLRRGYKLLLRQRRLATMPHFSMLREDNVRTRFPSVEEVEAVISKLPERMKGPVTFIARTGWRANEAFRLQWRHVDLKARVIRLEASEVKNRRDARILPYGHDPELAELISERHALTDELEHEHGTICPWVFWYKVTTRRGRTEIRPVQTDADAWKLACEVARVPDFKMHDMRRAFARAAVRAGVDEMTIMRLAGWRTRCVFDRYSVRSTEDLAEGVEKLAAARQEQSKGRAQRQA